MEKEEISRRKVVTVGTVRIESENDTIISYKNLTYNDFTYNTNKCDIKDIFLFTVKCKVIYLYVKSVISNVIISNVNCIKCYKYCHYMYSCWRRS